MREKQRKLVITFHTTAAAMAMEKRCHEKGLPGRLAPVPRSVTSDCGIAWCAPASEKERFSEDNSLPEFAGIYEVMM